MTQENESEKTTEASLYAPVRDALEGYLRQPDDHITMNLEITATGFSQLMQRYIPEEVFNFIDTRDYRPDLYGRIGPDCRDSYEMSTFTVVAEVKKNPLELKDLFQAKRYGELYKAEVTPLISPEWLDASLHRLLEKRLELPSYSRYWSVYMCRYDRTRRTLGEWFDNREPRKK
jgi:hypothetical protein